MRQKLNTILLIDDDAAVNYIHSYVIKKADVVDKVVAKTNGQMAIDYLATHATDEPLDPELIFLDINMPGMDGWGFLEEYKTRKIAKAKIVMLTTSQNESDKERALGSGQVVEFISKPLTKQALLDVVGRHF